MGKKQLKSNKENNALPVAPTSDIPVQEGFQNELKTKKKDKKRKKFCTLKNHISFVIIIRLV